ncbi:MAG: hypothetical protein EBV23_13820, partial [Flavobacteriia bacterium]|nr:hypothetical protein [Flavobacteriia bacterium]
MAKFFLSPLLSKKALWLVIIGTWILCSCEKKQDHSLSKIPITLDYAKGFQLFQGEGFWEIQVSQGYA